MVWNGDVAWWNGGVVMVVWGNAGVVCWNGGGNVFYSVFGSKSGRGGGW